MAYSEKVIDHYENPRNVGQLDENSKNVGTTKNLQRLVRESALRQSGGDGKRCEEAARAVSPHHPLKSSSLLVVYARANPCECAILHFIQVVAGCMGRICGVPRAGTGPYDQHGVLSPSD